MDKFTASNGVTVWRDSTTGNLRFGGDALDLDDLREKLSGESRGMYPAMEFALREFFQAERDEELGRWRWPKNPDYVVYPKNAGCPSSYRVVDERDGCTRFVNFDIVQQGRATHDDAARAYIEAHPERKPWHDAEEGEIWALTGAGGLEQPWRRASGEWRSIGTVLERTYDAASAIAGRRIWPEAS